MGEAKRRMEAADLISVLIPERGRPEMLERCICSLIDKAGGDDRYEIIVAIDDDDPAWRDRRPFDHTRTRYLRRPRPATLGVKLNDMAREARGGLILWLANDQEMVTRDWPARCREAAAKLPNGIGVAYLQDPLHLHHASYWMLTRKMVEAGFRAEEVGTPFAPPWFPYWFCDTWWTEVGVLSGLMVEIDAEVSSPDGRGRSHALVDLPFWVEFFNGTRPLRVRNAIEMAQAAYGADSQQMKEVMLRLESRQRTCVQASEHLSSPAFLKRWGDTAESEPGPAYADVKAQAQQMLAEIKAQEPRRPRVAICCPSGETWKATTGNCIAAMAAYSAMAGVDCSLLNVQMSSVAHVRNTTVELALAENSDFILWVDSDMKFPPDTLVRLLGRNRPICGALYNKKFPNPDGKYQTLGLLKGQWSGKALDGLQEALLLPAGLMLVRTDIYRSMAAPWYFETYSFGNGDGVERFRNLLCAYFSEVPPEEVLTELPETRLGAWVRDHYTTGEHGEMFGYFSEDLNFCRAVRRRGWTLWADLDLTYEVAHLGTSTITCLKPEAMAEAAD